MSETAGKSHWLPALVSYTTFRLPNDGVQLTLQVALTMQDQLDGRYQESTVAMHRNDAKAIGEALLASVTLIDRLDL